MTYRTACALAVSIALILSGAAFPGGALLCREGNGDVNLEPPHAPHAESCLPDDCHSDGADAPRLAHRHERCTDTEASDLTAPAKAMKHRPDREPAAAANDFGAEPASLSGPAVPARSAAPPPPSHTLSTNLRI